MVVLLVLCAGIAVLVGAKNLAQGLIRGAVVVALVATVLPFLAQSCTGVATRMNFGRNGWSFTGLSTILGLAALGIVGLALWRLRTSRERLREAWQRRHGSPQSRSLPLAPVETPQVERSRTGPEVPSYRTED